MAKASLKNNNNRVAIELPRGLKEDQYIAVNGVAYVVPRKGRHEVPPEIAEEYARSTRAEDRFSATQDTLRKKK